MRYAFVLSMPQKSKNRLKNLCLFIFICLIITNNCAISIAAQTCITCHSVDIIDKFTGVILVTAYQNTHPPTLTATTSCATLSCHSPETLINLITKKSYHKDRIRQLDPAYYQYAGPAGNTGCNKCHGEPPRAICPAGVADHCPSGTCDPVALILCGQCHINFASTTAPTVRSPIPTSAHIYLSDPLDAQTITYLPNPLSPQSITTDKCAICHGLFGSKGAHSGHISTALMFSSPIQCLVCHPGYPNAFGPAHVKANACIHTPVVAFNPALAPIDPGDAYNPLTGTCVVYCHSNGSPLNLIKSPIGWFNPPLTPSLCGLCHLVLPHGTSKTNCANCHYNPTINNAYHIDGNIDGFKSGLLLTPFAPRIAAGLLNNVILPGIQPASTIQGSNVVSPFHTNPGSQYNGFIAPSRPNNLNAITLQTFNPFFNTLQPMTPFITPALPAPLLNTKSLYSNDLINRQAHVALPLSNPYGYWGWMGR